MILIVASQTMKSFPANAFHAHDLKGQMHVHPGFWEQHPVLNVGLSCCNAMSTIVSHRRESRAAHESFGPKLQETYEMALE